MTEKSSSPQASSPEMTSQSFAVSYFGLAVLYSTGSEIHVFWYVKIRGRKIAIDFLCYSYQYIVEISSSK